VVHHPGSSNTDSWLEHAIGEPDKLGYYVLRLSCMSPLNMGPLEVMSWTSWSIPQLGGTR
jgi:hypothetical protein